MSMDFKMAQALLIYIFQPFFGNFRLNAIFGHSNRILSRPSHTHTQNDLMTVTIW